jgi:subtilisin family serine protease
MYLGSKQFAKENNKWYILENDRKFEVNERSMTVKFTENVDKSSMDVFSKEFSVKIERENELGYIDLEIPEGTNFKEVYAYYIKSGLFESVEMNSYGSTHSNDPGYSYQYYLYSSSYPSIGFPYNYGLEDGSTNPVLVAVIDIGVNYNHNDLNMWSSRGKDYIDNDNYPYPDDSSHHGTAVAGIFGAITNNNNSVAGIAGGNGNSQTGAKIMSLRVGYRTYFGFPINDYRDTVDGTVVDDAILWAANNGAKVINMSIGVSQTSAINSAINYAYKQKGCVLVASAGNESKSTISYPSSHTYVIAVGGILKNWGNYGNYGTGLDLVAPAEGIYSTTIPSWGLVGSGTSFSSPQVAGTAALLLSQDPDLLHIDVKNIIKTTAKINYSSYDALHDGSGILSAGDALEYDIYGPQNVSITATAGTHPIISWSSLTGASQYKIYRANSSSGRYSYSLAGTTSSTSWTDSYTAANPKFALSTNYYRVTAVVSGYESITSSEVSCGVNATNKSAVDNTEELTKIEYELSNNYPNPFNPSTIIKYSVSNVKADFSQRVILKVYDVLGKEVRTLVNEDQEPGKYSVNFNASELSSGIYLYSIKIGSYASVKKMILTK